MTIDVRDASKRAYVARRHSETELHKRICALAAPDKTRVEIARLAGCDPTYVTTVLEQQGIAYRREGHGNEQIRHVGLKPDAKGSVDGKAAAARARDALACDELLARLRRFHPRA